MALEPVEDNELKQINLKSERLAIFALGQYKVQYKQG